MQQKVFPQPMPMYDVDHHNRHCYHLYLSLSLCFFQVCSYLRVFNCECHKQEIFLWRFHTTAMNELTILLDYYYLKIIFPIVQKCYLYYNDVDRATSKGVSCWHTNLLKEWQILEGNSTRCHLHTTNDEKSTTYASILVVASSLAFILCNIWCKLNDPPINANVATKLYQLVYFFLLFRLVWLFSWSVVFETRSCVDSSTTTTPGSLLRSPSIFILTFMVFVSPGWKWTFPTNYLYTAVWGNNGFGEGYIMAFAQFVIHDDVVFGRVLYSALTKAQRENSVQNLLLSSRSHDWTIATKIHAGLRFEALTWCSIFINVVSY